MFFSIIASMLCCFGCVVIVTVDNSKVILKHLGLGTPQKFNIDTKDGHI